MTEIKAQSTIESPPEVSGMAESIRKVLMFLAVIAAIGAYLYTVYVPKMHPVVAEKAPVLAEKPRFVPTIAPSVIIPASDFRPLPADQIQLIISTFAPEQLAAEDPR